uniref:RING-type E3 ubiquitin transferase n=1 Tax=Noccaea caerulescens TaxID=107243 RepID=A0A1J3FGS6_NOCCA
MAEPTTADTTASNADTLRLELKKTLTEFLEDGRVSKDRSDTDGSFNALKAIDESMRILNRLREVESKKPESESSSSSPAPIPKVPEEFRCSLANNIMSEPVVIASGQTYEKRYITQWLMCNQTCPKTFEVLSHRLWAPNHLVDDLIEQWCRVNNYDRPKPFTDDIDSLLTRMSSPCSVEDQILAAKELRCQSKIFGSVRAFFAAGDSITRLLSPISALGDAAVDSNPKLQKNIITTLLNISNMEQNKTLLAENPLVIQLLTKSLKQGKVKTRRNAAQALSSLSSVDSNKIIICNEETLDTLLDVVKDGDFPVSLEAIFVVSYLCRLPENRGKAVSAGLIPLLTDKIRTGGSATLELGFLASMSTHDGVIEEMEDLGFIDHVLSILRESSREEALDKASEIISCMLSKNSGDRDRERNRVRVVGQEEKQYRTFTKLAEEGSELAVGRAQEILQRIKREGAGEEEQQRE